MQERLRNAEIQAQQAMGQKSALEAELFDLRARFGIPNDDKRRSAPFHPANAQVQGLEAAIREKSAEVARLSEALEQARDAKVSRIVQSR